MSVKSLPMVVTLMAIALTITACGLLLPDDVPLDGGADVAGVVFVQRAEAGVLDLEGGIGTLTLAAVEPEVLWVTDRPERSAGSLPLDAFLDNWRDNGFSSDPPNAILESFGDQAVAAEGLALILRDPRYDSARASLRYSVDVLSPAARDLRVELGRSALFIDSATGAIRANVVAQDGTPLPAATLILSNPAWSHDKRAISDANGAAMFTYLAPDTYKLTVTMTDMETWCKPDIVVGPGATVTLNVTMQVAVNEESLDPAC